MRIFLLEDDPSRIFRFTQALIGHEVTTCMHVDQARDAWRPPYDVVSLDHDLGGDTFVDSAHANTGAAFARWLTGRPDEELMPPRWFTHSLNPDGARNIVSILAGVGIGVSGQPFGKDLIRRILEVAQ